jgi:hypothetical protein
MHYQVSSLGFAAALQHPSKPNIKVSSLKISIPHQKGGVVDLGGEQ